MFSYTLTPNLIKALTALVDRLSLIVSWENGHERGLKTVSFNPKLPVIKQTMQS